MAAGLLLGDRLRRQPLSSVTRAALMFAGVLLYAQLLALFHPAKPLEDAVFHAHRFEAVLAGHYFFTQPMPAGVRFPYAIALYVWAAPWAALTRDHVALLRIVVCASDLGSYLLLYWLIVRTAGDRLAACLALVLSLMLPITFVVIGNANLTNEFGHAGSIAALVLASAWPDRRRLLHAAGLTLVCAIAFLSHVSTIALLACALVALAVLHWLRNGAEGRRRAWTILGATAAAGVISIALYYGHFGDVYLDALRVRGASAASGPAVSGTAGSAVAIGLGARLATAGRLTVFSYGWPLLLLAGLGAWPVRRRGRGDPLALLAAACAVAFVVFAGVGVMRVDPRFERYAAEFIARVALAASPGLIVLAALGAAWALRGRPAAKLLASALLAWSAVLAVHLWLGWFS